MSTSVAVAFLRTIADTLWKARAWEMTAGRKYGYQLFVALLTNARPYACTLTNVSLLASRIQAIEHDDGVLLYTADDTQVNAHLLVAKTETASVALLIASVGCFGDVYPTHTINLRALRPCVVDASPVLVLRRRTIPHAAYLKETVLDAEGEHIACRGLTSRVRCLVTDRNVTSYHPATRIHANDPDDRIYWYRFACGRIAVFQNPRHAVHEAQCAIDRDVPVAYDDAMAVVPEKMRPMVSSFLRPSSVAVAAHVMARAWIPRFVREHYTTRTCCVLGIHDALLEVAHVTMPSASSGRGLVAEMAHIGDIMAMRTRGWSVDEVLETLSRSFRRIGTGTHLRLWAEWMRASSFVVECLTDASVRAVELACTRYPPLVCVMAMHQARRCAQWTSDDEAKASIALTLLADSGACHDEMDDTIVCLRTLRSEWDARMHAADTTAQVLLAEESTETSTSRQRARVAQSAAHKRVKQSVKQTMQQSVKHRGVAQHAKDRVECAPQPSATSSHIAMVNRLAAHLRAITNGVVRNVDLIGSGVLRTACDADVVLCVSATTTLEDAHAAVRRATGWRPKYDCVSETHVAVLEGAFEGVAVDAQVWREGEGACTPVEAMTANAVALWKRIATEADDATRNAVRKLHAVCDAAGVKGHTLCRMSGVGITCLGVLHTRGCVLTNVREWLATRAPHVNFDEWHVQHDAEARRCEVAAAVVVSERNCASRMTRATTRHFLDAIAYALTLGDAMMVSTAYETWRRAHMVVAARVRTRTSSAIAQTLHRAAVSIDGHPLVDAAHIRATGDDAGQLEVLVTLRADADAVRYGFDADDAVELQGTSTAIVTRRGRTYALCLTLRAGNVSSRTHLRRVSDTLTLADEMCIPNAPTLTCDVRACFDARTWET